MILRCPSVDTSALILGVNHHLNKNEKVISAALFTTNCLAPLTSIIDDNYERVEGFVTTVLSLTGTQWAVDSKGGKWWSSRGGMNIIPATACVGIATVKVLPETRGKIAASARWMPLADVSVIDFCCKS